MISWIFILGCAFGSVVTGLIFRLLLVGTIRVDYSDPFDGPYMFLEISKNVESITSKRHVLLKVSIENFVPRK